MTPAEAVERYVEKNSDVKHFCVAFSGGVDSHVLLAHMASLRDKKQSFSLRAVHVDHGLQEQSADWAEHATVICKALNVVLDVCRCKVVESSKGPEASARRARFVQFEQVMPAGSHLLLAQHAEDQAETFLLQALRGSGPDGLAGIPKKRAFGKGMMARPLLQCSQASILEDAHRLNLRWVEDPSNQQTKFDRNFLRQQVMPLLKSRWPAATQTLGRSAMRCAATSKSMMSMAQQDLDSVKVSGQPELRISLLKQLPKERAFTAIRLWVRRRELPMPRLQDMLQVHHNLINARPDSNGVVNVREYEFRRHRDSLYLLLPQKQIKAFRHTWHSPYNDFFISETGSTITLGDCFRQGIRLPDNGAVILKSRSGGELIRLGQPAFHKSVKSILQESSIPPWQRSSIPLVYVEGELAAVWQLAVSVDHRLRVSAGQRVEKSTEAKLDVSEQGGTLADA